MYNQSAPILTSVTIANGQSLSGAVELYSLPSGLVIPAAWTAANITFQASADGNTYNDLYDESGNEVTIIVGGASRFIRLTPSDFAGMPYIKIRSGTTGTAVAQGALRQIFITARPI